MGGSVMQVLGEEEGRSPCVCWRDWGRAREDTECANSTLTLVVSREGKSAVLRAVPCAWEPAVHLMNSSHLLSSRPVPGGEKDPGATNSEFLTGPFSAHLYQPFLQTSTAVNTT